MAKKLTSMSWDDMQNEMSLAGNPEKVRRFGQQIMENIEANIDGKNIPEIVNTQFALKRIMDELKLWEKIQRNRQRINL